MMKKIALVFVFLLAFNGLFFLLCDNKNTGVWISYGFVHFSFLLLLAAPLLGAKGKGTYILNAALYSQAILYFAVELVAGSVFVALQLEDILWPLLVQGILWAVFMSVILINAWANDDTQRSLAKRDDDLRSLKESLAKLKLLSVKLKDDKARRDVLGCYNELFYSPTRQEQASVRVDAEIEALVDELDACARQDGEADRLQRCVERLQDLVKERKEILKYSH